MTSCLDEITLKIVSVKQLTYQVVVEISGLAQDECIEYIEG